MNLSKSMNGDDKIMVKDDHGNVGEVIGFNPDGTVLVLLLGEDEPQTFVPDDLTSVTECL